MTITLYRYKIYIEFIWNLIFMRKEYIILLKYYLSTEIYVTFLKYSNDIIKCENIYW